jgi:glycosyltransferase involved in cell wall biosynthesis
MGAEPAVLFIATPLPLGGSNRSLATLLAGLEGSVHRVLACPATGSFVDLARERGLADEFVTLPRRPRKRVDRLLRLVAGTKLAWWGLRNRSRLAAIHANALTGLNVAVGAALVSRKPLLVWVHDPVGSSWGSRLGPMIRRLLPGLRIAAVSPTAEGVAVAGGLCRRGDAVIVPNPIDPADVVARTRVPGNGRVRIGILGGATERKGFDLLPAVIGALSDLPLTWRLHVHLEPQQENAATWQELDAFSPEVVVRVGKVVDVRRAYAELDVVFCPSRAESFCRVAAEAMLNGLPVVASDIEPLRALLGDDEAGITFSSGDAAAAARALRSIVGDPGLAARLGEEGRRRAEAFSPEAVTHTLRALYGLDD